MSDQIIPFGNAIPPHLFDGEPHTLIYDPEQRIPNPTVQLNPFGPIVHVYHEESTLLNKLNQFQNKQLIILLIVPTATEVEMKTFIMRYIFYQPRLHSLFLIFHNGLQCHEQWSRILLRQLCWCRSVTNRLIPDILEVCQIACNQHISFYEQRRIQAEDNIFHNNDNSSRGIATFFAQKKQECSSILYQSLAQFRGVIS